MHRTVPTPARPLDRPLDRPLARLLVVLAAALVALLGAGFARDAQFAAHAYVLFFILAGATVVLLRETPDGPSVLMGRRGARAAFMPSKYVFPGGALDPVDATVGFAAPLGPAHAARLGELAAPLSACAIRELWEETGVPAELVTVEAETPDWIPYDLPHDLVPRIWKGRFRGQEQKWFLLRYKGRDDQVNIDTDHPEFSEWRWLPPSELVGQIVPFKRAVYQLVLDAFEDRL